MDNRYQAVFDELQAMGCPVIERPEGDRDGAFVISAEENDEVVWASYYADSRSSQDLDDFGVNLQVNAVLERNEMFAEWINPGCLGVYDA